MATSASSVQDVTVAVRRRALGPAQMAMGIGVASLIVALFFARQATAPRSHDIEAQVGLASTQAAVALVISLAFLCATAFFCLLPFLKPQTVVCFDRTSQQVIVGRTVCCGARMGTLSEPFRRFRGVRAVVESEIPNRLQSVEDDSHIGLAEYSVVIDYDVANGDIVHTELLDSCFCRKGNAPEPLLVAFHDAIHFGWSRLNKKQLRATTPPSVNDEGVDLILCSEMQGIQCGDDEVCEWRADSWLNQSNRCTNIIDESSMLTKVWKLSV